MGELRILEVVSSGVGLEFFNDVGDPGTRVLAVFMVGAEEVGLVVTESF